MRNLSLTKDHIAKIHRAVEDGGAPPGMRLHTDSDYDDWVTKMVQANPAPHSRTRLFAYGSLIWKPEIEHLGEEVGTARGWHRSFCFRMPRFRGTPEAPGLMMALDRGGQCGGVLYDLPDYNLEYLFGKLFRRELTAKPANSMPRWIVVQTEKGPVHALTFVMNRESSAYVGRLPHDAVADVLARSCGHWGTGAEYLLNAVTNFEAKGIHDSNLWRLQHLVAERIDRMQ